MLNIQSLQFTRPDTVRSTGSCLPAIYKSHQLSSTLTTLASLGQTVRLAPREPPTISQNTVK